MDNFIHIYISVLFDAGKKLRVSQSFNESSSVFHMTRIVANPGVEYVL